MLRVVRLPTLVSLIALSGLAGATRPPEAEKISLRFKPAPGAKFKYDVSSKMSQDFGGQTTDSTSKSTLSFEVLSSDDKAVKIRTTIEDISTDNAMAAAMIDQAKGKSFDGTYDDHGRTKEIKGDGSQFAAMAAEALGGAGFLGVVFPDDPVDTASIWSSKLDVGKMVQAMSPGGDGSAGAAIPITFKVMGFTDEGGKKLVSIDFTIKGSTTMTVQGNDMSMKVDSSGTVVIDAATGLVQSETVKGKNTVEVGGNTIDQDVSMTMTLKS